MATVLIHTSPARGHLFPVVGFALELHARGHKIHVRTLASEVDRMRELGFHAEPMDPRIEVDDVASAVRSVGPDVVIADTNSWGAQAVAESSGLPWVVFQPYFSFRPARGVPPFGRGLARSTGIIGRIRDSILRRVMMSKLDTLSLPAINEVRGRLGLTPLGSLVETLGRPPVILYFTAEELDYPRERWPDSFHFIGPGLWEPTAEAPKWLPAVDRPIALVTCSTERQSDRSVVETALESLPNEGYFVVATSAAYARDDIRGADVPNTRLERFIPHGPVVERAEVVVCHEGVGITQRALAHGVPVVVIPFGRDQREVARRVELAGAGVFLDAKKLSSTSLVDAVRKARSMGDAA